MKRRINNGFVGDGIGMSIYTNLGTGFFFDVNKDVAMVYTYLEETRRIGFQQPRLL